MAPAAGWQRVRVGQVWMDALTMDETLDAIVALVEAGKGGAVFTPNVDHIVMVERHARFRAVYGRASLALVDGTPVLWASRLLGTPLPAKVSGSDLVLPLAQRAAAARWRVYLIGGGPGTAAAAAARLSSGLGVDVVGFDAPMLAADGAHADEAEVFARIERARPDLVFVAFGAPKQEFWIERARPALGSAVAVAVGAGLEFLVGQTRRAPRWMSAAGLEWLHRLAHEPRRLWRRYLLRDPQFALIVAHTFLQPRRLRLRRADAPVT